MEFSEIRVDIMFYPEVAAKGIDLGEMNSKLLQKIEALTLYLIEHRKEMDALKADNKGLHEAVAQLKEAATNTSRHTPQNSPVIK